MATHSETARRCLDLAVAAAPAMIGRAIDQAVATLQEQEQRATSTAQRQELADAWLELSRRRGHWSQRYPALLRIAPAARAPGRGAAPSPDSDRFGGLALVDEEALACEIEAARVLQLIAPRLEQPLAELDALMSTALGLDTVHAQLNPLRPEVFAAALREVMQPVPQPAWSKLWSQHLASPLAGEIETLYRDAIRLLRAARLTEASYRVLPAAAAPARPSAPAGAAGASGSASGASGTSGASGASGAPAAAAAAGPAAPTRAGPGADSTLSTTGPLGGAAWADLSGYALGDELFQNFLFSRTPPSTKPLAPAFYAEVDTQLAAVAAAQESCEPYDAQAVQRHRALSPVERPHRAVGTARELDDMTWGRWAAARERALHRVRLKKEARQVGQVLGLEVVRKLVDQVALDPRLLAPVREAIVALEPALARLALVQPRFFAEEDHAGRRLVERVAERSFRYNDEFASDFHEFFQGVRSAFQALNDREDMLDDAPFAGMLQRLEDRWSGEDATEEPGRQVAVDAVHFAEAREAEAARIAWSLSQRSDLEGTPAVVQDFLFGPWSQVMAHARLTDPRNQVDPGGWNSVIGDLLWSVKSEQTLRDPARLIATIPGLLERLRGGMSLLGQDPSDHADFFQALEKLHRPVLKLRARSRHANLGREGEPQLDPALLSTERRQPPAPSGTPWLTPKEVQAAGFEQDVPSAPAPLDATPDAAAGDVEALVAGLQPGCWVDLQSHGQWRRASLTWVSARATLFMFVSRGGQPHSMTRRSLERLARARQLRPVEAGAVVPRALEALSRPAPLPAGGARRVTARLAGEERVAA